ncbi:MAG: porin [Sideroxydans sp.]|jgi:predicted porin
MQKKIIALAVAAAFSTPAFADVGFYGIVDATIANISASGTKGDFLAVSGGASQSRLGVKATEDIGNGLTAVAVVEYGLDTETNDGTVTSTGTTTGVAGSTVTSTGSSAFTPRQKMLAVAGDFGTVATGYLQTAAYDFLAKYDPIYGSGSSAHTIAAKGFLVGSAAQRAQRAVAYISPNINGLVLAANYSTALTTNNLAVGSGVSTGLKTTAYILSANYAVDALSVGAVYAATSNASTPAVATNTEFAFGASYDLGVAKVMGTYQSDTASTAGAKASTVFSGAVVVPVATGAIAAMYAKNSIGGVSAASGAAFTAGYLHTFTKSTTGYVVLSQVTNGSASTAYSVSNNALAGVVTAGGSSTLLGVGLRKKF